MVTCKEVKRNARFVKWYLRTFDKHGSMGRTDDGFVTSNGPFIKVFRVGKGWLHAHSVSEAIAALRQI